MNKFVYIILYPFVWLITKLICWDLVQQTMDIPIMNKEGKVISTLGKYPELIDDEEADKLMTRLNFLYFPTLFTIFWLMVFWSVSFMRKNHVARLEDE